MTISSSTRIAGPYVGTGVSSSFPFAFKVFAATDMYVVRLNTSTGVETVLVLNSDYTVTLNANQNASPGGTIVLPAALASGYTLTITSNVPLTQATDLTNQGGFYPEVITNALDKVTILAQQLAQESGRQIVAPISDGAVDMELPAAGERASQYLAFDATGRPIAASSVGSVPVSTFMQTVLDDTSAAAARTTLGAAASAGQTFTGGITAPSVTSTGAVSATGAVSGATVSATGDVSGASFNAGPIGGARNRIINGAMRIDQRNEGGSVSFSGTQFGFSVDRWYFSIATTSSGHTIQRVTDAPTGFLNSLKLTIGTGGSPSAAQENWIRQYIEGYNVADFLLGTSNAVQFTLSFWVKSSVTGTFAVAFHNPGFLRSYVATYTIAAANTWEYKTVTVTGDLTGTWPTDNAAGLSVRFDLGSGSNYNATSTGVWNAGFYARTSGSVTLIANNGATFLLSGVQLERGAKATPFAHREFGVELALCQRYYEKSYAAGTSPGAFSVNAGNSEGSSHPTANLRYRVTFKVSKRASPSFSTLDASGAGGISYYTTSWNGGGSLAFFNATTAAAYVGHNIASSVETQFGWTADAEM